MTQAPQIDVQSVTKIVYNDVVKGRQTIVDDLSVKFRSGRSSALLGHNGAGKTTTIKLILGLVRPTRGQVTIDNSPVGEEQRRFIGYMPEVNRIPLVLNPIEVLTFHLAAYSPRHLAKSRSELIEMALRQVDLWDHRKKRVGKLSKGMARRLAWAQATIHDPEVLILDEPMSGLDPTGRLAMKGWISEFRARGKTIILCSHELATVGELCDDVAILRKGRLVFSSTSDERAGAYQLSLSGMDDAALLDLRSQVGLSEWIHAYGEGFIRHIVLPDYQSAAAWLQAALARGVVVTHFGQAPVIDEDILLRHFGKELES